MKKRNEYDMGWSHLEERVKKLSKEMPGNVKSIYGLPRGGLVPAVMLSHLTGLPLLMNLDGYISFTMVDGRVVKDTLIVDDIYDTGKTLEPYLLQGFPCMVVVNKKPFYEIPNNLNFYYSGVVDENVWMKFPWETKESSKVDYLEKKD